MKFKISGIIEESTTNGLGLRLVVFFQGCNFNCPGCHNPQTHDIGGGYYTNTYDILDIYKKDKLLSGITLSGGEPFLQPFAGTELALLIKNAGGNVWCYTGYKYEELLNLAKTKKEIKAFLDKIDVLVDGKFDIKLRNEMLRFRGSSNQRIIDLSSTRKNNTITLLNLEGDN